MMPDPAFYAECLNDSFKELKKAFQVESAKPQAIRPAKATGSTAKAPAKKVARKKKKVGRAELGKTAGSSRKKAAK
jgi:hypothetical protein